MDIIQNVSSNVPTSLQQQNALNSLLAGEKTSSETNEGYLLSLITMQNLFSGDEEAKKAIGAIAKQESVYLLQAMKTLGSSSDSSKMMREKFGKDFAASIKLANLLKVKAYR